MRLHLHDFSGHPFQVQLSRRLAALGDEVRHSYCDQYVGGKGTITVNPGDPETFTVAPVHSSARFDKYHPVRRAIFELAYARDLWRELAAGRPDAVVLCNAPLLTTYVLKVMLRRRRVPWIFWHQDIYSMGMRDEVARRLPAPLAWVLAGLFARMERACVQDASAVVAIDEVFLDRYRIWKVDTGHVTVIPNWAPLADIRPVARDNEWSRGTRLPLAPLRVLYSGTLGRKHNPLLLVRLLRQLRAAGVDAHLIVVSQGDGVEQLRAAVENEARITLLPFQPAERLAEVLSSADVLVALLEPKASRFSIPSKVLSYLAAGRPIAGLMPEDNAAALAIRSVGSVTASPDDRGLAEITRWIWQLSNAPAERERLGYRSRSYAEREFDINSIGERFQNLLTHQCATRPDRA